MATPSVAPTQIPVSPTSQATLIPNEASTVSPTQTARPFTRVKIFLVALNDTGASGPPVGCGECDDPRVATQLAHTARQFATVQSVIILLNGRPLEQLMGSR